MLMQLVPSSKAASSGGNHRPLRGQLFAKEKYLSKKN